jgi:predicted nucleic acid-binding protein
MAIVLFDSNILIDNFNGYAAAALELLAYEDAIISSIVWMEVACIMDDAQRTAFDTLLDAAEIRIVHPNDGIMRLAATIRGNSLAEHRAGIGRKLNLPDCIIRATAEVEERLIVTRNPADFGADRLNVRVPYELVGGMAVNIQPPPP